MIDGLFQNQNFLRMFAALVLLLGGSVTVAYADDGGHKYVASNAKWQAECGSCHVAFPPRMLPAESWREMMLGLSKHFGSDASLDAPTALEIGTFLGKHAGTGKHELAAKPPLRITETRWFIREHDEVPDSVWKNPKVKSAANCAACHIQAESGNYSEHNIRMPR